MSLVEMQPGQEGIIVEIDGGRGVADRLWVMGIFPGKKNSKAELPACSGTNSHKSGESGTGSRKRNGSKVIVEVTP